MSKQKSQAKTPSLKTVYLIRHGQSKAQVAKKQGIDRKRDTSLLDCGLTTRGVQQAEQIPSFLQAGPTGKSGSQAIVELVVSSPLTRALQTAVHGFQTVEPPPPILLHYGLREIGSSNPENCPRNIHEVLEYIQKKNQGDPRLVIDSETLRPADWPQIDRGNASSRLKRIQEIFRWLALERPEQCIAVVCHFNVIRAALASSSNGESLRPHNAHPILCRLHPDGKLTHCEEL